MDVRPLSLSVLTKIFYLSRDPSHGVALQSSLAKQRMTATTAAWIQSS